MTAVTAPKQQNTFSLRTLFLNAAAPVADRALNHIHQKIAKGETHFIMKKITGGNDKQTAILPDDQWLISYIKSEFKTNAKFKSAIGNIVKPVAALALGGAAIVTGLTLAAVSAPVTGIALLMGTTAFTVGSIGLGLQLVQDIKSGIQHFQDKIVPDFKKNIALAYGKHKATEFKNKWKSDFKKSLSKLSGTQKQSDPVAPAPAAESPKVRTQLKGAFSLAKKAIFKKKPTQQKTAKPANPKNK